MAGQERNRQRLRAVRILDEGEVDGSPRARSRAARLVGTRSAVRARGLGAILDFSLEILIRRFAALVGISAVCWLPVEVLGELLLRYNTDPVAQLGWFWLLAFPLQVLTVSLVSSIVGGEVLGVGVSALRSIRLPPARILGVGFISLVTLFLSILGCCLGCIGLPAAMWLFSIAPAVYVLESGPLLAATRDVPERARGAADALGSWYAEVFRAMGRSFSLVAGWGGLGRWLGYTVVGGIMIAPLTALSSATEDPTVRASLEDLLSLRGGAFAAFWSVLNAVFAGAGYAYMAVAMTVFYFDRRVEREGLDLELELERLPSAQG